jgi:uncharacterized linocin/CFP29 family protein
MLQERAYNYFDAEMLELIPRGLVGTQCIALFSGKLPPGTQMVTQEERLTLEGEAKRGIKGQPIPREIADFQKASVVIPEIAHGFYLHRKDLQAAQNTGDLPTSGVEGSSTLVRENLEDLIFNGDISLGIKGIYRSATGNNSTPVALAGGKEWNVSTVSPVDIFNDVVDMETKFKDASRYSPDKMVVSPKARMAMFKADQYGNTAASMLAESGLFIGGMSDILEHPMRNNDTLQAAKPYFAAKDLGLMFAVDKRVADRIVEEDINLRYKGENESEQHAYNIVTYQTIRVKRTDAFMKLDNLVTV